MLKIEIKNGWFRVNGFALAWEMMESPVRSPFVEWHGDGVWLGRLHLMWEYGSPVSV